MESVMVFLRTELFSYGHADAHVPNGVMVIEGRVVERLSGGLRLETDLLLDLRGRELSDEELTLELPWAKIDHIVVQVEE
ncbi:MAG: hypothetical protein EP330_24390 [Deltaproteobacteria bacterium]|nr:MAG: hypothetical protein EP330_24390 [Deltaproteobacteria bacterium]